MKLTKTKLKQIIREEIQKLNETNLYRTASILVNKKDITAFAEAGQNIKYVLEDDGYPRRDIKKYLQEIIELKII